MELLLSLCIPTNGIPEWFFPVLDSIYKQADNLDEFEVVVSDNGDNEEFSMKIQDYVLKYHNLKYVKTSSIGFTNQIDCFKLAKGKLIKFVNHRMVLCDGSLEFLISFARNYKDHQPVVYFSNSELALNNDISRYDCFNEFIYALGYWSSWSAGIAVWKDELETIDFSKKCNTLFPHTFFLFNNRHAYEYLIVDKKLAKELETNSVKKGNYNIIRAFSVEYIDLIESLLEDKAISNKTYQYVKKDMSYYISTLVYDYVIRKKISSFSIDNYKANINTYYNFKMILLNIPFALFNIRFYKKVKRFVNRLFIRGIK